MDKVTIVFRNADFTEGRGPMLFDGAFSSLDKAKEYVNSKGSGIMGAKPDNGMTFADWCMARNEKGHRIDGGWGGYDIIEYELDAKLVEVQTKATNEAWNNLTDADKEAIIMGLSALAGDYEGVARMARMEDPVAAAYTTLKKLEGE